MIVTLPLIAVTAIAVKLESAAPLSIASAASACTIRASTS
jgi:hypothetical protein